MEYWSKKRLREIITGFIFIFFAIAFFITEQYWISFLSIALLIPLLKLDDLKKFILSPRAGLEAEFQISEENIEKDIKENNEKVTKKTFVRFKRVEEKVLRAIQKRVKGEMKRQIHLIYRMPDRPDFKYTPDATIQTEKELIFLEIKYILKPELSKDIVTNALGDLKIILDKFRSSAGKKLVAKLILVSEYNIDYKLYNKPQGIEIEFYKILPELKFGEGERLELVTDRKE